eukprot:10475299-Ditylum_brightwellii.AAC.1
MSSSSSGGGTAMPCSDTFIPLLHHSTTTTPPSWPPTANKPYYTAHKCGTTEPSPPLQVGGTLSFTVG